MKTTDNGTYHTRTNMGSKAELILNYVKDIKAKSLVDIGCNNGVISHPIQQQLGVDVLGIDDGNDLVLPSDYKFIKADITMYSSIHYSDVTLLLSVYHHLFGAYGETNADELFLTFLLRSKQLVFDCGNPSEKNRTNQYWYNPIKSKYRYESDILNHFNIKYESLGTWNTGGGTRTLVAFDSSSFDYSVNVVDSYKRPIGSKEQYKGLQSIDGNYKGKLYEKTIFTKLEWNGIKLFAKKHLDDGMMTQEQTHISTVYNEIDSKNLLKFYGISDKYGFIYEWVDNIKYKGKCTLKLSDCILSDVDIIEADGKLKYIDFWV